MFFRKLNTKALKVFFVYTLLLAVCVISAFIAIQFFDRRDIYYYILRLFTICEFIIIVIFLTQLFKNKIVKKIALWTIAPYLIYTTITFFITNENVSNFSNIFSALLLITLLIYFFYEKMKKVVMYPIYQSTTFWICVAFFLYFTGTFFFFIFIKSVDSMDTEFLTQMNIIYSVATMTKNIILCLALIANENVESDDELHIPTEMNLDEFSHLNLKNP